MTRDKRTARALLCLILIAFGVLCLYYNYSLPLFEGYDEISHYRVVEHYARQLAMRRLALPDLNQAPSHEAHQPPLYYVLAAPLIAGIDRSDFSNVFQVSAHAGLNQRQNGAPTDLSLLPHGTTLAVRLLRMLSSVIGATTIVLVYALATQLRLPRSIALLAAAFVAFNPKFIYLSSMVTNDIAVACAASASLVLAARVMTQQREASWWQCAVLGASVGVAALCKYSGLAMLAPAAFAIAWSSVARTQERAQEADWLRLRSLPLRLGVMVIGFTVVAGWLFAYQWLRYGHPLAWEQVRTLNAFSLREARLTALELLGTLPHILPTFWRVANDSPAQMWIDFIVFVLSTVAVVGFAVGVAKKIIPRQVSLLLIAVVASFIALIPWERSYGGTEDSRLLTPAFGSLAILFATGLLTWLRTDTRRYSVATLTLAAAASAALAPAIAIAPNYPPLQPIPASKFVEQVSDAELAALPSTVQAEFDNGIELMSASVKEDRLNTGEPVQLTLYWRVNKPIARPYKLSIEALDEQKQSIGHLDTPPLGGRRPTNLWQVGDVFKDEHTLSLDVKAALTPTIATLFVSWQDPEDPEGVSPHEKANLPGGKVTGAKAASAQIGKVKVRPAPVMATMGTIETMDFRPDIRFNSTFSNVIRLEGYDLERGSNRIKLYWRSLGTPNIDYNVFIHVFDQKGRLISQSDGPVTYSTSFWEPGEQITDVRDVPDLMQADEIQIGLYDLKTGQRLSALRANGFPWKDNSIQLWRRADR